MKQRPSRLKWLPLLLTVVALLAACAESPTSPPLPSAPQPMPPAMPPAAWRARTMASRSIPKVTTRARVGAGPFAPDRGVARSVPYG